MKILRLTIIAILLFTTGCIMDRFAQDDLLSLPPRIDKQEIKERFSDLPFDSEQEIKVALLLPLSGKHKKLGLDLYRAAQLALFDHGDPRIVVYPYDSKGSEFTAISVMNEIAAKNIKIVVGPVFSKNVKAIKPIAVEHGITIFTFSNNTEIAGDGTFVLGMDVKQQVKRIISYAIKSDIGYYTALAPASEFGSQAVQEMRIAALDQAMIMKSEFYVSGQKMNPNVNRILRTLEESPVDDEGNPIFKEVPEGEEIPLDEMGVPEYQDIREYRKGLLIADGSKNLERIATMIDKQGLAENTKLLGLSLWDNSPALKKSLFQDAWYTDLPKTNFSLFEDHFEEMFSYTPQKIAIFSYDMLSVISALASYQGNDEQFTLAKLTSPIGFSGISGVFRFRPDGVVERLLEIYEIKDGVVNTREPAPFQFSVSH